MENDVFFGKCVLLEIPIKYAVDLSAGRRLLTMCRMSTVVATEKSVFGIIPHMGGMDNQQILSMVCMRTVPVGCDNTSHSSVIKRKRAEMFGNENDGIPLVFIRAKGPGG